MDIIKDSEISIQLVKEIFQEMFLKQQKEILKLISGNLKITNERIEGLLKDITLIKATCESLKKRKRKEKSRPSKVKQSVAELRKSTKGHRRKSIVSSG
jgi:Zn-dependent peptidase ImmA (M78 family)